MDLLERDFPQLYLAQHFDHSILTKATYRPAFSGSIITMKDSEKKGSELLKIAVWIGILLIALALIAVAFATAPPIPEYARILT